MGPRAWAHKGAQNSGFSKDKLKEIQDIINFIKKTDLDDVSIETENYKIRVKKNNTSITQIKGKKEKKYDDFLTNIITEYYHISKSEATDYLDILYLSKEGKVELKGILQKYGTDPQIIKKFKLEK